MKKIILKVAIVIIAMVGVCFCFSQDGKEMKDLTLNNIEALANGEGGSGVWCFMDGTLDCNGGKYKYEITGISL